MKIWWKETVFYEIYIASFKDDDGDGIGDLKGIIAKLDYLQDLGIGCIWLTPFYPSPKIDNGYDVSNYKDVDQDFGTLADFAELIKEAHRRGIKVIIDLVINHTSTAHPWFIEASDPNASKRDWYIWRDEPNNWESFFGGSAWAYDERSRQYYYHSFSAGQADLNWSNPEVKMAIFAVIDFWVAKGIDGFRLDVINNLTLQSTFPNNPVNPLGEQEHVYDKNQAGIKEVLAEIDQYLQKKDKSLFTVGEISSDQLTDIASYAGKGLLDVTFNFNFGSIECLDVPRLYQEMIAMEKAYQGEDYPTLFFGSHDMGRLWNRLANKQIKLAEVLATLILTARGVPFIYFGDEVGMEDLTVTAVTDIRDVQGKMAYRLAMESGASEAQALQIAKRKSRDKSRAPMLWANGEKFSLGTPWIKEIHADHSRAERLHRFYQQLIALRKTTSFSYDSYDYVQLVDDRGIIYKRGEHFVGLNFSPVPLIINHQEQIVATLLTNDLMVTWTDRSIILPSYSVVICQTK